MLKRILAMVLVLAMVMSLMPSVVLAEGTEVTKTAKAGTHAAAGHSDDCGVTTGWEAWGDDASETGLPTSGKYYLTKDVTLTAEHTGVGNLTLCLNGYVIKQTASKRVMSMTDKGNGTLTICDCTAYTEGGVYYAGAITGGKDITPGTGAGAIFVRKSNTLKLYDGRITGNTAQFAGAGVMLQAKSGDYAGGKFYMHGGEISNNTAVNGTAYKSGGGIYMNANTYFEMTGGTITGNKAQTGAGIYFGDGTCVAELRGGTITGNEAVGNSGGIHAAYTAATVNLSGNIRITGNTANGAANNLRIGNSGKITVGQLGESALVGITVGNDRDAVITKSVAADPAGKIVADDDALTIFLNAGNQLEFKKKPVVEPHKHTLCNDTGCTDHTDKIEYEAWGDDPTETGLPSEAGNYYLTKDVTVSAEVKLETAITINLCLNGHKVTGEQGSNVRAYSTTNNVASTINISNCNGDGTEGKFYGFRNTSTGSGGGVVFVRPGSTLRVFDVAFENNVSYAGGAAIMTTGTTYLYDCTFKGNEAYKVSGSTTTWVDGGAVFVNVSGSAYGQLHAYKVTFENNKAKNGAAIYAGKNSTTYVEDGTFKDNIANAEGGVYNSTNGNATFKALNADGNQAKNGAAVCVFGGSITVENAQITGNHAESGFGTFHMSRSDSGATPVSVVLKGKVVINGNTAGTDNKAQNLFMREYESYVDATGLTAESKIGVTMRDSRIAAGLMNITTGQNGVDNSSYFASDDAAYVIAMEQEVCLKEKAPDPGIPPVVPPVVEPHKHTLCNDTGCADHGSEIEYQPWDSDNSLPDVAGSYYLTKNVTLDSDAYDKLDVSLTICLHGFSITQTANKRVMGTKEGSGVKLVICDCEAKEAGGVYSAGAITGGKESGSGAGGIFIRRGTTLELYDGRITGNTTTTAGAGVMLQAENASYAGGKFYMHGGEISENTAISGTTYKDAGGVYMGAGAYFAMSAGTISGNEGAEGGAVYMKSGAEFLMTGGTISGNKASASGGAIHFDEANCTADLQGGVITGNEAGTNGGAMNVAFNSATVKLSGNIRVTGNTVNGAANNVRLGNTGKLTVGDLGSDALIGITVGDQRMREVTYSVVAASADKIVTDDDTLSLFMNAKDQLQLKDKNAVYHEHCVCGKTECAEPTHYMVSCTKWDKTTSLPTSGSYFLDADVEVAAQAVISGELNLCLNGKTISVAENSDKGRAFYITNNGTLTITDCTGNGKITGATNTAIQTNGSGTNMTLNLYAGNITGNHIVGSGAAVVAQGQTTFNMYGGAITNNKAESQLTKDAEGNVQLDSSGSEKHNEAKGGAVYVYGDSVFNMYGGEISGNEVTSVTYVKRSVTYVMDETDPEKINEVVSSGNSTAGGNGGGLYVASGATANLLGGRISGNTAYFGGGVFAMGTGTRLNVAGTEISDNTARNGGGIITQSSAIATVTDGKICGNTATNGGAGVYVSTDTWLVMTGGEICENTAANGDSLKNGGGIYVLSAEAEITGGKIWGNKASGGAGIYSGVTSKSFMPDNDPRKAYVEYYEADVTIGGDALITENEATSNGGGIMVTGHADMEEGQYTKLTITGGTISGNTANNAGGVLIQSKTAMKLQGGKIAENTATNGGGVYVSSNSELDMSGGEISGNTAKTNGGGINTNSACVLKIKGGKITGNTAGSNGGGINAANDQCALYFSGNPVIMGNKLASGKANNVRLGATGMIFIAGMLDGASIGITADPLRTISNICEDYSAKFISDDPHVELIYKDEALYTGASGNHTHCNCMGITEKGCDHEKLTYVEWDDPTDLPESGRYYLSVDVTISKQKVISNKLDLCLNGHTVKVAEESDKGRVFYLTTDGTLNITDCAGGGKLTGSTAGAILSNASGKNMTLNLYGGNVTGNTNGAGGGVVVQGECTFNMYGGAISGNTAASYLKTDESGKVILDSKGNETYFESKAGGVYVTGGVFNMYGGTISGNEATTVSYMKANATAPSIAGGNGGGLYLTSGATFNLYGGSVTGNTGYLGGGVFAMNTDTQVNVAGGEISNNTARHGGGVITQTNASTTLTGGKISGNVATNGGAGIYVSTGTKLVMTGGEICQNVAGTDEAMKPGGGLYVLSSVAELSGGKIWGNKASSGAGVYGTMTNTGANAFKVPEITLKDPIVITENQATENGGGIMVTGHADMPKDKVVQLIMQGGTISKNSANNAGGILVQSKAELVLQGGKITENTASTSGAGVYVSTGTKLNMTGGEISANTANSDGGGLFLLRCEATISGGTITGNAALNGGGVKVGGAKLTVKNLTVSNNKATGKTTVAADGTTKVSGGTAGGLWVGRMGYKVNGVQMYATPSVTIHNIQVTGNAAAGAAGGILVQSEGTQFNMTGGTVSGNTATANGGAIYLSTDVKANITGGTFSGNKAKSSGAIHITKNNANISGVQIFGNESVSTCGAMTVTGIGYHVTIKNSQVFNNTAGTSAGAIAIQGTASVTMENAKFYGNKCLEGTGGAIYFSNPGYGDLKNVEVYENESSKGAGGIYIGTNSSVTMDNMTIRDNVANGDYGGGVYNRGRLEIANSKILNNTAKGGFGGGIGTYKVSSILLADDAGVFATNCVISGNKADEQGGGVNAHRGCPVYLTDCVITDNTAVKEGGAIHADGRLGMQNVTATGNTSGGEGYAVYLAPSLFDGHSYQTGHKKMGGEMIVKDNKGGDMYLAEGTALAVTGEALGEKTHVAINIHSGVLTQWVQGVYNYEGGDCAYVITAGNRSITDPETVPVTDEVIEEQPQSKSNDVALYAGIGLFAVAVIAVAAVVLTKKKKAGKTAEEATKE